MALPYWQRKAYADFCRHSGRPPRKKPKANKPPPKPVLIVGKDYIPDVPGPPF